MIPESSIIGNLILVPILAQELWLDCLTAYEYISPVFIPESFCEISNLSQVVIRSALAKLRRIS